MKAAGSMVLSAGTLGLIGCGGSGTGTGSGNNPTGSKSFTGQVATQPGVSQSSLIVAAGLSTTAITNGTFSVSAPTDAPSLVTVLNPKTKVVLFMGMYDPTISGTFMLNAKSTAITYLFFALGGSTMARNGQKALLEAIKANAATTTFITVVTERIAANAPPSDPQVVAALSSAAKAIAPSVANAAARVQPQAAIPTLLLIQPSGEVNGVTFVQQTSGTGNGFNVQNVKRRGGYVYTYLTGHVSSTGVTTSVTPPTQVGAVLEIASTSSLLKLGSGWSPTASAVVPLTLQGSDSKSLYQMVFLAPIYGAPTPAFFADSLWAKEVPKWNQSLLNLCQDTFVGYIANIIFSAIGFGGLTWLHAELGVAVANLTAIPSVATLLAQAAGPNVLLSDLANVSLKEFVAGDISQALLKDIGVLLRTASAEAAATLEAGALSAAVLAAIEVAVATFLVVGAIGLAVDLGAVAIDTSVGDRGDLFTATVVKQTLILSPLAPNVAPGGRVSFSVKPPTGLTGTINYDWTQTSQFATLSSADGVVGNSITTSSTSVDLVTTGSDANPITVTVTGYETINGVRTEFGKAQTVVKLTTDLTVASSRTIVLKENPDGSGRQFIYEFNCFSPVAGAKSYQINGATLYDYQYARGAPPVDTKLDTDMDFVSYQIPADGSQSFFNIGGIGYMNPELSVESGGYFPGNGLGQVGSIVAAVDAEPNPTVTITF
jgi:hypothetical protein